MAICGAGAQGGGASTVWASRPPATTRSHIWLKTSHFYSLRSSFRINTKVFRFSHVSAARDVMKRRQRTQVGSLTRSNLHAGSLKDFFFSLVCN